MKQNFKPGLFPWFSLLTGLIGLSLQSLLFSEVDAGDLLPQNHIGSILSFVLFALTIGVCLLVLRKQKVSHSYRRQFPQSLIAAAGGVIGAGGLVFTAFSQNTTGLVKILFPALGVLAAAALLLISFYRVRGLRPHYLLRCAVTLFLTLRAVQCCRVWGSEPQLQLYFFPLLASLFLILACYYRTELDAKDGDCRRYCFFSQAALFCCCLCVPGQEGLFYLAAGIWMAADYCALPAQD